MRTPRLRHKVLLIALVSFLTVSGVAAIVRLQTGRPLAEPGLPAVVTASPAPALVSSNISPETSEGAASPASLSSSAEGQTENEQQFEQAAQQNAELQNNLSWTFGGKQQKGWYLYIPLIRHLIGTESSPQEAAFALALSRWQRSVGLPPNGVLDNTTLAVMITTWQSRRIKDKAYPSPDQLVMIPTSDLYDPMRPEELRKAETEAYAAYKRMMAAAVADKSLKLAVTGSGELAASEKYLKIVSAFRSREYQEQLRKQSPNAGRAGLAVNSPHFTGRALDLYVGGEPVSTEDSNRAIQVQTKVYLWLVKNAERFGFRPYFYEPWHWEYVPNG
ncbi:MAG: D-alanyl-D-alanine carboxypeptidase family protein [Pyrinomonadaceae bacterium]|nr:D-alanyl-D-alanine carboxypeptidase family protein [Pyrinomonadaceae bacterium]